MQLMYDSANAQFVYNDCYTASDFGQIQQDKFTIRPVGDICYLRCQNECSAFSQLVGGVELNQDIIDKCNATCRAGNIYSSATRIPNNDPSTGLGYTWSTTISSTKTNCATGNGSIDAVGYNLYNTQIQVAATDKVQIKIFNPGGGYGNLIYMCGSSTTVITTGMESMLNSDWINSASLWQNPNTTIANWNARNNTFTDTGIDIKDGDYISLTYGGQYRTCNQYPCNPQALDAGLFIKAPGIPITNQKLSPNQAYALPSANLQLLQMDSDGKFLNDPQAVALNNAGVKFMGLQGSVWQRNTRFNAGLNFTSDAPAIFNGSTIVYSKDTYYTYTGLLSGFSTNFTRLAIAHPDQTNWADNLGGYLVNITRKGCQYVNGDRLQFAIAAIDPTSDQTNPTFITPVESDWTDLTSNNLVNYEYIPISTAGLIYLRIKPLPYDASVLPTCDITNPSCILSVSTIPQLYTPANTDGQYYVIVQKSIIDGSAETIITQTVNLVRGYLFGSGTDQLGMVQTIFNRFVTDSGLMDTIRALILLYIAFTGLSFMIGIAQFTQQEGISRILKMAIVLMLISQNSWQFFNDNLFKLFTDGALELLVNLTADPDTPPSQMAALQANPTQIFTVFNEPFSMLFGRVTWIKVTALIFSGPIGFVIAVIIAIAGAIYAICIGKAALLYLLSLIGISVLLLLAPIFISFILFRYTKQMFDAWLQQLLSFTFQPIFVFVFIIVINNLILAALQTVLGFTACSACWFSITIPGNDPSCIIPGYISLYGIHNPTGNVGVPMQSIAAVFYILILAQAMYAFTDFGAKLANLILTSQFGGVNLGAAVKSTIATTQSIGAGLLGVDQGVIQGARDANKNIDKAQRKTTSLLNKLTGKKDDDKGDKGAGKDGKGDVKTRPAPNGGGGK